MSGTAAARPAGVVVLMSTFRGERHVAEQLRSVLAQLPQDGRVLVRDDGSDDGTVAAVQSVGDPRITLERGGNLGFAASFLTLLSQVPPDTAMVMFCDQDDVWLPHKIERARAALAALGDVPALYASAQLLADELARPLHARPPCPGRPSFAGALTENIVTGCTAALNNAGLRLLQRAGVAAGIHFHDWWLYLVVAAFGSVVYDDEPTLLYRQHGRNLIGYGAGWRARPRQVARLLTRTDWAGALLAQVEALLTHYGADLPAAHRALVLSHFSVGPQVLPRWRLVFGLRRWRRRPIDELALRALLAAWRLRLWPPPARRLRQAARQSL